MKKSIFLGMLASLFFAATFVLNRSMNLGGGYWLWSASLRYLFIRMANMGLGALFTFVGLLILNFRTQFNIGAEREACYNESKKQIGGKLI